MKVIISSVVFYLFAVLFFSGCQGSQIQNQNTSSKNQEPSVSRETLINANKQRMLDEVEKIDAYVERNNFKMTTTPTGVRMLVLSEGTGPKPELLADVEIKYIINGLDGSYIYSSDSSGTLSFVLGQSAEPSGLQEALLKLNEGSKALLIIPSYLAYGLTGDGDKIDGEESLVYSIELIKVHNN